MGNRIILKKSSVADKVPLTGDLEYGELAINYADGKLYFKDSSNNIANFTSDLSEYVTLSGTQTLTNKTLTAPLVNGSSGDTGASLTLTAPETNTDFYDNVIIDTYQNKIRIYESGGTNRGFYLDITDAEGGIGTNLLASGTGGGGGDYTLPTATTVVLGGVKVDGTTITINGSGVISAFSGVYGDLSGKPELSTVATTGDYDDLSNKPTLFSGSYNDLTDVPTLPTASFQIISVAGQSNVIADNYQDTLTLVAGDGITITTNNSTDSITIAATGGGAGGYELPAATTSSLGGVIIGNGLQVSAEGVVDVIGASGSTASGVVPYDMGYITENVYTVQDHGSIA